MSDTRKPDLDTLVSSYPIVAALLGCDYGKKMIHPSDDAVCTKAATMAIMLYEKGKQTIRVQMCDVHGDLLISETDEHLESPA